MSTANILEYKIGEYQQQNLLEFEGSSSTITYFTLLTQGYRISGYDVSVYADAGRVTEIEEGVGSNDLTFYRDAYYSNDYGEDIITGFKLNSSTYEGTVYVDIKVIGAYIETPDETKYDLRINSQEAFETICTLHSVGSTVGGTTYPNVFITPGTYYVPDGYYINMGYYGIENMVGIEGLTIITPDPSGYTLDANTETMIESNTTTRGSIFNITFDFSTYFNVSASTTRFSLYNTFTDCIFTGEINFTGAYTLIFIDGSQYSGNLKVEIDTKGTASATFEMFESCTMFNQCRVTLNHTTSGQSFDWKIFDNSVSLNNMYVVIGANIDSSATSVIGYNNCNRLSNCYVGFSGALGGSVGRGFSNSYYLTNCLTLGDYQYGYYYCEKLTNCNSDAITAYYYCEGMCQCENGSSYTVTGCDNCKGVQHCDTSGASTTGYNASYYDYGTSNACANTQNGGWNR